jgi:hypothetical protein
VTSKNRLFCCTHPPAFIAGQPAHKLKKNAMGSYTGEWLPASGGSSSSDPGRYWNAVDPGRQE